MILKQMGSTVGDSKKMGKEEQRKADEHAGFFLMEIHTSRDGFNLLWDWLQGMPRGLRESERPDGATAAVGDGRLVVSPLGLSA